jgi:hypothetical protein
MRANTIPEEVDLVFEMVVKRGDYSEMTKSGIWAEITRNAKLRNLALLYLVGNSNRAELNLNRLNAEIEAVFFSD